MSLRVWLPLNGSLKNQGLDKVTVTNNGATVDNNGKIGKCYSFGTNKSYLTISKDFMTNFSTEASACFWLKIISWHSNWDTFFQAGLGGQPWNHYIFGFLRNNNNSNCCFTISNGSSASNASYLTSNFDLDKWYHIGLIYKTGHCLIYINGELYHDYTTSIVPKFSDITTISLGVGNNLSGYQTNCKINDVRIYDHALSSLEVKRISQGLILHYPLDRNGWGNENLLSRYVVPGQAAPTSTAAGGRTTWLGDYKITIPATQNADTYFRLFTTKQLTANATYTISCKVNGLLSGSYYRFPLYAQGNTAMGVLNLDHNDLCSLTFTMTYGTQTAVTGANGETVYICFMDDSARAIVSGQGAITISNFKLEEGDKVTPWCPNSSDSLATLVGMNTNVVKDISGYQNNGELIGTFSYTTDTPKYNVSTYAQGGASTYLKGVVLPSEAKTVSLWIKAPKNVSSAIFNDKTTGLQIGLLNSLLYANSLASTTPFTTTHWTNDGWNHVVVINNNDTRLCYINGEAETQSGSNNYYIHNANEFWVWNRSYNNNYPFTGSLSDLRIYSTALSADEVKELYKNNIVN